MLRDGPGYPPPGYGTPPGPYGYLQGAGTAPGTEGFAIAALILSILGAFPLSAIFGFLALRRIKRSGQGGRGLAIAAVVISSVWAAIFALAVIGAVAGGPDRDVSGTVTRAGSEDVTDLKVGDCLATIPREADDVRDVDVTPCTKAHRGEVYATFDLADGAYPGEQRAQTLADEGCEQRAPTFGQTGGGKLEMYFFYPQRGSWKLGDRTVTCVIATSRPVTTKIVP